MIPLPSNCMVENIEVVKTLLIDHIEGGTESVTFNCAELIDFDSSLVQLIMSLQQTNIQVSLHDIPEHLSSLFSLYNLN